MKTDLIGIWSTYPLQGYGVMEDQMMVFLGDGTGWYDWSSLAWSNVKMFEWNVEESNRLHLRIVRRLSQTYEDKKWVEVEHSVEQFVLPFEIGEREAPFDGLLPFLRIRFGFQVEGYSLLQADPHTLPRPGATS